MIDVLQNEVHVRCDVFIMRTGSQRVETFATSQEIEATEDRSWSKTRGELKPASEAWSDSARLPSNCGIGVLEAALGPTSWLRQTHRFGHRD